MVDLMTENEFEELLLLHGDDLSVWPSDKQDIAFAFSLTKEGRFLLAGDALVQRLLQKEQENYQMANGDAAVFLQRLQHIPHEYQQKKQDSHKQAKMGFAEVLWPVYAAFQTGFSSRVLVSQAAVFLAVLGLGVMAGLNDFVGYSAAVSVTEDTVVDLSESLFANTYDFSESLNGDGE